MKCNKIKIKQGQTGVNNTFDQKKGKKNRQFPCLGSNKLVHFLFLVRRHFLEATCA